MTGPADQVRAAWRRPTAGEQRWPVSVGIGVVILLQSRLPGGLGLPWWVLPGLETALLVGLLVANPDRIDVRHRGLRTASLGLVGLVSVSNALSASVLVGELLRGRAATTAASTLLANGAAVYVTNIVAFSLWYWELDRGGPVARAHGDRQHPDFLFPQMTSPDLAPRDWEPLYVDYLYVSFTNAAAFSPTDTMPLSRWAKALMTLQSAVALVTAALVIARAVNILG